MFCIRSFRLTPEWQGVDQGPGNMTKQETGENLHQMQEDMSEDELSKMTASDRRVMLTHAVGKAWKTVCQAYDFEALFDRIGGTVGRGGAPPGVNIHFQCMKDVRGPDGQPIKFTFHMRDATEDPDVDHTGAVEYNGLDDPDGLDECVFQPTVHPGRYVHELIRRMPFALPSPHHSVYPYAFLIRVLIYVLSGLLLNRLLTTRFVRTLHTSTL